jgi:hypothetical protein
MTLPSASAATANLLRQGLDAELLQRVDVVVGHADDGGVEGLELVGRLGELVGLDGAAAGEGLG